MGDAEGDLFEEAKTDLAQGATAVIPIDDIDKIGFSGNAADIGEHDEMRGEAPFEFVVVLFVQIGVVDVEIRYPRFLKILTKVIEEIVEVRADEIGPFCFHLIVEKLADHAVEFAIADGGPEGVFGA